MRLTPSQKVLVACLALVAAVVVALATQPSWTLPMAARVLLAALAVASLGGWLWRTGPRGRPAERRAAPRLRVVQRVGLSQRNALALVEVDGRPFLVVHGDGFARIRPGPRSRLSPSGLGLLGHLEEVPP